MKNLILIILMFVIISPNTGDVLSGKNFHNSDVKKNQPEVEMKAEKNNSLNILEKKIIKKNSIFRNIPKTNQLIINNFLDKYSEKKYFSHINKISYRKNSTNRGLASSKNIYFDFKKIDTNKEFKRVMIHEMWHIFDLGYLKSKEKKVLSNFNDWTQKIYADDPSVEFYSLCFKDEYELNWNCKKEDFASKYWQTDVFEDFAESFLLYIENNDSFKLMANESRIMKKKYNFLKKYFWEINTEKYSWQKTGKRVWDLTLAY